MRLAPLRHPALVVEAGDRATLSIATSSALFESSPAVVIVGESDPDAAAAAAQAVESLGIPMVLATGSRSAPAVTTEVERLGARWVVAVGVLAPDLLSSFGEQVAVVTDIGELPPLTRAPPADGVVVLVAADDPTLAAATATVRASGLPLVAVDGGDPRAGAGARDALRRLAPDRVVAIGRSGTFPAADALHGLVRTVLAGDELPGGGQVLFPGRRLVALYGHPGDSNLGVLGEQPVEAAVERARSVAAGYNGFGGEQVIPTFEIITTVASSEPGDDGDYSLESSLDHIQPWVDAAAAAGFYVVLDLQPGYTDFLTQARRYEELLIQPHVGLALDPEWRLAPGERHMRDIGQVEADEVNRVATWLADLTRRHALPQKLFVLHQFRLDMVPDRAEIGTHPELALVVQMDGLGSQESKLETWRAITTGGPQGVRFGWKNFYDEDSPTRSPADTVALRPSPVYVSYQ
ncbi:hypothetical protein BH20ACT4_BH20ACT4_06230 [soil metagenome]